MSRHIPSEPTRDRLHTESNDPYIIELDPRDPFSGKQMIVGKDPFLEDYLRSPYDPVFAAMATGRMTGEVVRRPPRGGWMRVCSYAVAFVLIATGLVGSGLIGFATAIASDDRWFSYEQLRLGLFSIPGIIAGVLLLWRLIK